MRTKQAFLSLLLFEEKLFRLFVPKNTPKFTENDAKRKKSHPNIEYSLKIFEISLLEKKRNLEKFFKF